MSRIPEVPRARCGADLTYIKPAGPEKKPQAVVREFGRPGLRGRRSDRERATAECVLKYLWTCATKKPTIKFCGELADRESLTRIGSAEPRQLLSNCRLLP